MSNICHDLLLSEVTIGMKIFGSVYCFVNKETNLSVDCRFFYDAHLCPESRMLVLPLVLAGTLHLVTADVDFRSACDEISYGYCRYKDFCVCAFLKLMMNKVLSYLNIIPGKLWNKNSSEDHVLFAVVRIGPIHRLNIFREIDHLCEISQSQG